MCPLRSVLKPSLANGHRGGSCWICFELRSHGHRQTRTPAVQCGVSRWRHGFHESAILVQSLAFASTATALASPVHQDTRFVNNLSHEGQNRRPDADATVVDSCSKSPVVDVEGGCSCALTHRLPTSAVHQPAAMLRGTDSRGHCCQADQRVVWSSPSLS